MGYSLTGVFTSRRHGTNQQPHLEAMAKDDNRVNDKNHTSRTNERNRANRSHSDQLALLDKRLGRNIGAVRERKRLVSLIAKENEAKRQAEKQAEKPKKKAN